MLLATVASLIVLVVVVIAIAAEDAEERASRATPARTPGSAVAPDGSPAGPRRPPGLARPDFPRARDGYDPAAVDAYLDHLETLVSSQVAPARQLPVTDAEALRTEAALAMLLQRRNTPGARQNDRPAPYPAA